MSEENNIYQENKMEICSSYWVEQMELFYSNKETTISLLTNYVHFKLEKLFIYYFELKSLLR